LKTLTFYGSLLILKRRTCQIVCYLLIFFKVAHESNIVAQKTEYKIAAIGFYNFENLFDTLDTPDKDDIEFLPDGLRRYNSTTYWDKLDKLSEVVSRMGTDLTPDGPAILGCSEIETEIPLHDLVKNPMLANRNYQVIYRDGPDKRGVDVAMLYQPKYFTPEDIHSVSVNICGRDTLKDFFSRDILYVMGKLDGETIHIMVNHWPSRRGGEATTNDLRNHAACVCKTISDSILARDSAAKILIMGDLNDDPNNESVRKVLGAKKDKKKVSTGGYFNPWWSYYSKGLGTTAFNDSWGLFDQILVSEGWLNPAENNFYYYRSRIWNEDFMLTKTGQYKGFPLRTYEGDMYAGGYSDHLPVVLYFIKEKK